MTKENGRPRVYAEQEEPLKVVSVRLPFVYIRIARKLGDGCTTKGIREALARAASYERKGKDDA